MSSTLIMYNVYSIAQGYQKYVAPYQADSRWYNRYLLEGVWVEIVWTLLPAGILICIAFPSLQLLYIMDEVTNPGVTLKVVGHQ